jgi:hypothetical protein
MNTFLQSVLASKTNRRALWALAVLAALVLLYKVAYPLMFQAYVGERSAELTYENARELTEPEFERLALSLTEQARFERAAATVRSEPNPDQDPDQDRDQDRDQIQDEQAERFAQQVKIEILMNTPSVIDGAGYPHIKYFRDAGIRRYEGPQTCLQCHQTMQVQHPDGSSSTVNPLDDILDTVHFKFQSDSDGMSTIGYDGRLVNGPGTRKIPVGKIDRACGIPGSFSWTGWAALINSLPQHDDGEVVVRSEGCGQCHVGGNYYPATEEMLPIGEVPALAKQGIDCLICHSAEYDMNQRFVIEDQIGDGTGLRWNQDRSMRAALTVGPVSNQNCLHCHQHNMGGDLYPHNVAAQHLGDRHQRLLHSGAKRGNPFSAPDDVHAAAGIQCIDCHVPEGHKIPRGRMGVDLVANDLPGKEVACESCHSKAPHNASEHSALLNGHIARLACQTCHVPRVEDNSVVLRDWVHPTWDAEEGIWTATDIYRSGEPGKGLIYLWFNGNGTFLANALGNNPNGGDDYDPLMQQLVRIENPEVIAAVRAQAETLKQQYPDIDVDAYVRAATDPLSQLTPEMLAKRRQMIDTNLRQAMNDGESRIFPFKPFNALMFEDMNNQGPFGAMILPFDYARYYETGEPKAAVATAVANPIIQRMYQTPFKLYMMDEFMAYFGVEGGWDASYPLVDGELRNVEPHWMRQMGSLMVSHGIQREGHGCHDCHSPDGILDYAALGYAPERVEQLQSMDIVEEISD